jgi:hypothetical protein
MDCLIKLNVVKVNKEFLRSHRRPTPIVLYQQPSYETNNEIDTQHLYNICYSAGEGNANKLGIPPNRLENS